MFVIPKRLINYSIPYVRYLGGNKSNKLTKKMKRLKIRRKKRKKLGDKWDYFNSITRAQWLQSSNIPMKESMLDFHHAYNKPKDIDKLDLHMERDDDEGAAWYDDL